MLTTHSRLEPGPTPVRRALGSPSAILWLLALVAEAIYLDDFTLRFPLVGLYRRVTDIGHLTDLGKPAAAVLVAALVGLFALYLTGWWQARGLDYRRAWPAILGPAVVFGLTNLLMYPAWASDVYWYVLQERVWTVHGANPLVVPPGAFPGDVFAHLATDWASYPAPYGPVWVLLAAPASRLAGDDLLLNLLLFKGLALLLYVGCVLLVAHILGRVSPGARAAGTLFFAWNPLVLLEAVGNGHNDIAMTFFVLAAVALALSPRWRELSLAALALATLTKYTTVVLVPVLCLYLIRSIPGWRRRAVFAVVAGWLAFLAAGLAMLPFWDGPATVKGVLGQGSFFLFSPAALLLWQVDQHVQSGAMGLTQQLLVAAFGLFYLAQLARLIRRNDAWLAVAFETLFFGILTLSRFYQWYLLWPLALAAVQPRGSGRWRMATFGLSAELGVLLLYFVWPWQKATWTFLQFHLLLVPVVFLPPLLAGLGALVGQFLRRSRPGPPDPPGEPTGALAPVPVSVADR